MSSPNSTLAETLLDLVRIASPIGEERALADYVEARLTKIDALRVVRDGDSLIARSSPSAVGGPRVGLVGHLDTVRTQHDGPARIEGDRLYGAGAADMKSGLAVMLGVAERLALGELGAELVFVFYEREEGPFAENRLGPLLDAHAVLRELDLAICLEPSDNKLQLGCMGSAHARVTFVGQTAHSARPWQGRNAITASASVLDAFARHEPHDVWLDGMLYREVMTPTMATGGRARNIVPDRFELNVNTRFAAGKSPEAAVRDVEAFVRANAVGGVGIEVEAVDLSPAAHPRRHQPLVRRLEAAGVLGVESKQAWTDVARFDALGVPAVNFGPGTQAQAHQPNEFTSVAALEVGFEILERFLRAC